MDQQENEGVTVKTTNLRRKESMTIDQKSPEPKRSQIQRQITRFTRNQNRGYRKLISTDQFKDMIRLEREYGSIVYEDDDYDTKPDLGPYAIKK